MFRIKSPHFLTGEELTQSELLELLDLANKLSQNRGRADSPVPLQGQSVALVFEKPSLRTRVSFTVAVQELGGSAIELASSQRKHEEPEDTIRVLEGYCHGVMLRTHDHKTLEKMAAISKVPLINGLSDTHHPCQVLADMLTLLQNFGSLKGVTLTYVGDGNNMLHSLLLLLPFLGGEVRYACPKGYEPNAFIVRRALARAKEGGGKVLAFSSPSQAAEGAHAIYTDVWTSMGFEIEELERNKIFGGFQINDDLLALAAPQAIVLHCMPMVRGKEITDSVIEGPQSRIFQQSENRLHAQKALLVGLFSEKHGEI